MREKVEALESLILSLRKNLSETKDDRRLKKEEILSLKTKPQSLNDAVRAQALEISNLKNLNRKRTEIAINNADKLNAKLEEITKHNTVNDSSPYAAVGKTLQNGGIHVGKDNWLSTREYATVLCARCINGGCKNKKKYTEPEADKEAEKTIFYIRQKIPSLKRAQRNKREATENSY